MSTLCETKSRAGQEGAGAGKEDVKSLAIKTQPNSFVSQAFLRTVETVEPLGASNEVEIRFEGGAT